MLTSLLKFAGALSPQRTLAAIGIASLLGAGAGGVAGLVLGHWLGHKAGHAAGLVAGETIGTERCQRRFAEEAAEARARAITEATSQINQSLREFAAGADGQRRALQSLKDQIDATPANAAPCLDSTAVERVREFTGGAAGPGGGPGRD